MLGGLNSKPGNPTLHSPEARELEMAGTFLDEIDCMSVDEEDRLSEAGKIHHGLEVNSLDWTRTSYEWESG